MLKLTCNLLLINHIMYRSILFSSPLLSSKWNLIHYITPPKGKLYLDTLLHSLDTIFYFANLSPVFMNKVLTQK